MNRVYHKICIEQSKQQNVCFFSKVNPSENGIFRFKISELPVFSKLCHIPPIGGFETSHSGIADIHGYSS